MEKQDIVFGMLKPLDFSIGVVLDGLKKAKLFEPTSEAITLGLKTALATQYKLLNDLKVEGTELVPKEGGVIFAPNHQSWADVQAFGSTCPRRLYFVAKAMFKKWPILRHLIEINGGIYVHRSPNSKKQTSGELKAVIDILKEGKSVCIFPEGTIPGEENIPRHEVDPNTGLLKGKSGVIRLAIEAGVPVVPVGISGTGRAFPPEIYPRLEVLRLPGNTPIKVKYGKPIYLNDYYGKDLTKNDAGRKTLRALTDDLMHQISALVDHSWNYIPQSVPIKPLPKYEKVGVLVLHGFTSGLDAVEGLTPHFKKAKLNYEIPVLKGHGTTYKDLVGVTAQDWYKDAETALLKLKKKVDKVVVIGFSMGGLLAIDLAMKHPDKIAGIETIGACVKFADPLTSMTPILAKVFKFWPTPDPFNDKDKAKESKRYRKMATDAFNSLYAYSKDIEKRLPELKVPIRIIQAKKDAIVAPVSANIIYENVSSTNREINWFNKSGHEMLQDLEAPAVINSVMEFIAKFNKEPNIEVEKKAQRLSDVIE